MKAFYSDTFRLPLPEGHRFPMGKYTGLRLHALESGVLHAAELFLPAPATVEQLSLVHTPEYIEKVLHGQLSEKEIRRLGFPWSPGLVERSLHSVGATIAACQAALQEGIAANLAGGTHHAYPDHGEGYCVFNDCAVAARQLQQSGQAGKILIIDLDVHQGNGTAAIFTGDPGVFTFSMHGRSNYPFHKESSDLDIALEDGCGDEPYISLLQAHLPAILASFRPDFAIYLAGADPYFEDRLGRLALTKAGLARRDEFVLRTCHAQQIPLALTMAGGYAKNPQDIVEIHLETLRLAVQIGNGAAARFPT